MLDHNQLTPEETQEQNQSLIQGLRRYYNTRAEDTISLARIQARLIEKATSLPVAESSVETPLSSRAKQQKNARRTLIQTFTKNRPRRRTFGTLAATILLAILVGSFALLIHTRPGTGAIQHGWTLVAQFSGTGSKTISRQHIEVGRKFGWLVTCTNTQEGGVAVKFNIGNGWSACRASRTGSPGPVISNLSTLDFPPIQTIEVTTNASTSWELLLFKGTYYPPLSIDRTNWQPLLSEMDGTGNGTVGVGVTLSRTWGLLFSCHGTGDIQISLQPPNGDNTSEIAGASTPCNGQPNFDVSDISGLSEQVFQMQITTGADNDWQVLLVACSNGKPRCGITIVTPTATP